MPERSIIDWRPAPGNSFPSPDTSEIVVFESFFCRGFGLPLCSFARRLLEYYGLELIHLNPNSIFHLAISFQCEDIRQESRRGWGRHPASFFPY